MVNPRPIQSRGPDAMAKLAEIRKEAFDIWVSDPDKSYTNVAKQTRQTVSTIHQWAREDGWHANYTRNAPGVLPREYIQTRGIEILDDGITKLHKIITTGSDRDAVNAFKTLVGIMGIDTGGAQVIVNADNRQQTLNLNGIDLSKPQGFRQLMSEISSNNIIQHETVGREKR